MKISKIFSVSEKEFISIVKDSNSQFDVLTHLGLQNSGYANQKVKERINLLNIDTSHFYSTEKIKRNEDNIFCRNSTATQSTLRKWFKKRTDILYKCSICGQEPNWNNKPMILILDHINGIHNDDELENLRWVCPNCNSQLDTTNGKNIKNLTKRGLFNGCYPFKENNYCPDCGKEIAKKSKYCLSCYNKFHRRQQTKINITKNELEKLIKDKPFTEIGRMYGVTDNAIRKWCKKYNLPYKKEDII